MSLLQGAVLSALVGLVILHMARPRFKRQPLSAARFFYGLQPPQDAKRRLAVGNPLRSRPLYPQLGILGLLAAALLVPRTCKAPLAEEQLGLWVLVDTSYSMTTVQNRETRLQAARREVLRFLRQAAADAGAHDPCLRLSAFDLELRSILPPSRDRGAFEARLDQLEARALGTDLGLVRRLTLAAGEPSQPQAGCPTHNYLVVSDLPAPDWVGDGDTGWIWRDVGEPVDNVGFVGFQAQRNPFGGGMDSVAVEVAAWGAGSDTDRQETHLEVHGPNGSVVARESIEWSEDRTWRIELDSLPPGRYHLRISPGGAYAGDDEATLDVPQARGLRVDWRLPDSELARRLGWRRLTDPEPAPDLSVLPLGSAPPPGHPTLVVGDHYGRGPQTEIGFFAADSPLLHGLSFDVAETARILGVEAPSGFDPVLTGSRVEREVWVAQRLDPPGVYLPGLPTGGDASLGHFSAALFVQALRWLVSQTPPPPLFSRTSPAHPQPSGSRIPLHEGEGQTDHEPLSQGDVDELQAGLGDRSRGAPAWPWWLAAAAALLFLEQALFAYAGEKWR